MVSFQVHNLRYGPHTRLIRVIGVFIFLSYTIMNKINSLHHVKDPPKIRNFLQFQSHSSKSFKVGAISDLRDLEKNMIQRLISLDSNFFNLHY